MRVRHRLILLATTIQVAFAFSCAGTAHGQTRIVLKSGESAEFGPTYWIANCKSLVIGLPVIEVLEGPPELILTFKEGMVTARRQNCPNKVAGGTVVVTAKDVKERTEGKLTYRLKYKTKDGERLSGHSHSFILFPD